MAVDSSSIRRWLSVTAPGLKRYAMLQLRADAVAGPTTVASWVAADVAKGVKADPSELADLVWEQIVDHTDEAKRHCRFTLRWLSAEGEDLASKAVRAFYRFAEDESGSASDETSAESQIALAQKHSEFNAQEYHSATQKAFSVIDNAMRLQERLIAQQQAMIEAMHNREMQVLERETAAADKSAQTAGGSTDAEILEAQGKAALYEAGAKYLAEGGADKVGSAIIKLVGDDEK